MPVVSHDILGKPLLNSAKTFQKGLGRRQKLKNARSALSPQSFTAEISSEYRIDGFNPRKIEKVSLVLCHNLPEKYKLYEFAPSTGLQMVAISYRPKVLSQSRILPTVSGRQYLKSSRPPPPPPPLLKGSNVQDEKIVKAEKANKMAKISVFTLDSPCFFLFEEKIRFVRQTIYVFANFFWRRTIFAYFCLVLLCSVDKMYISR